MDTTICLVHCNENGVRRNKLEKSSMSPKICAWWPVPFLCAEIPSLFAVCVRPHFYLIYWEIANLQSFVSGLFRGRKKTTPTTRIFSQQSERSSSATHPAAGSCWLSQGHAMHLSSSTGLSGTQTQVSTDLCPFHVRQEDLVCSVP